MNIAIHDVETVTVEHKRSTKSATCEAYNTITLVITSTTGHCERITLFSDKMDLSITEAKE